MDDCAHGETLGGTQVDHLAPVASLRRHPANVGVTSVGRQVGVPLQGEDKVRTAEVLVNLPASKDFSGMKNRERAAILDKLRITLGPEFKGIWLG